jgi:hypothetical protein
MRRTRSEVAASFGAAALLLAACQTAPIDPNPPPPPPPPPPEDAVLLLAGDIGYCTRLVDEATANLLDDLDGTIIAVGDMLQEHGAGHSYESCYGPSWGRHLDRTLVAMGNHEYQPDSDPTAAFDYFGDRAGPRGLGYYSLDIGAWHVIVLNSNDDFVSTAPGSPQEQWLRDDLAAHADTQCVLAVWHHARFYTGGPGRVNPTMRPLWQALYEAGADVVVNGHFHHYERYGPQDPDANADPDRGIVLFTVGTGGGGRDGRGAPSPNVQARGQPNGGVLRLTLQADGYRWEFLPAAGETFTDSGSASCH